MCPTLLSYEAEKAKLDFWVCHAQKIEINLRLFCVHNVYITNTHRGGKYIYTVQVEHSKHSAHTRCTMHYTHTVHKLYAQCTLNIKHSTHSTGWAGIMGGD